MQELYCRREWAVLAGSASAQSGLLRSVTGSGGTGSLLPNCQALPSLQAGPDTCTHAPLAGTSDKRASLGPHRSLSLSSGTRPELTLVSLLSDIKTEQITSEFILKPPTMKADQTFMIQPLVCVWNSGLLQPPRPLLPGRRERDRVGDGVPALEPAGDQLFTWLKVQAGAAPKHSGKPLLRSSETD